MNFSIQFDNNKNISRSTPKRYNFNVTKMANALPLIRQIYYKSEITLVNCKALVNQFEQISTLSFR